MDFEKVYNDFLVYASKRHKKQCFDTLKQVFNKNVLPYFVKTKIEDLNIQKVIQWQDNIYNKQFSNNYNKNIYSCFKSFLNYCVLNKYIDFNYLDTIGSFKKKLEIKTHNTYTYFEYKNFRKGIENIVYRFFFDFLFFYGVRSGEAMALKYSDIKGKYIYIGSTIQRRGKREIDTPKTAKSIRYLYLKPNMRLKLFILKCYYIKKYCDNECDYFIFGGKTPLSPTSINRYKHNACVNRNIKEITTHEFRHSYATRMIKLGVPIYKVSSNLGHSSISITLDIYYHNEKQKERNINSSNTLKQIFNKGLSSIITHFV